MYLKTLVHLAQRPYSLGFISSSATCGLEQAGHQRLSFYVIQAHSAPYRLELVAWFKEPAQHLVCCSYCYKKSLITTVIIIIARLVLLK